MPKIMALEGPAPDRLAQLRGELYASVPRRWWRSLSGLGMLDPGWLAASVLMPIGGFMLGLLIASRTERPRRRR